LYFTGGAAAARRGYHALIFAGPGQGSALRDQKLLFRPDWDAVIIPAVDWLVERPEVDPDRIALMGMSFGGYLAPRAAAGEHRLAALIAFDGMYSFADVFYWAVGSEAMQLVHDGADQKANALIEQLMSSSTQIRSFFHWGMWALGADSPIAVVRAVGPYTMEAYAPLITCPTLVLDGESDQPMHLLGSQSRLYETLTCQKAYHLFPEAEGGGLHCQLGALSKLHQVVFDWLDTVLASAQAPQASKVPV
jgi:alpha-beta hydrolase superfamily lysophospholipase